MDDPTNRRGRGRGNAVGLRQVFSTSIHILVSDFSCLGTWYIKGYSDRWAADNGKEQGLHWGMFVGQSHGNIIIHDKDEVGE